MPGKGTFHGGSLYFLIVQRMLVQNVRIKSSAGVLFWSFLYLEKEHPIVNTLFNLLLNGVEGVGIIESISSPMFVQL
jgi:hypothetical protein